MDEFLAQLPVLLVVIFYLFLFVLIILWILLPFVVFAINSKVREMRINQERSLKIIAEAVIELKQIRDNTGGDSSPISGMYAER